MLDDMISSSNPVLVRRPRDPRGACASSAVVQRAQARQRAGLHSRHLVVAFA
jgi:hypothetical protein